MASESNGEKSKIIYFLLALIQTVVLAWCWKVGDSAAESKTSIATLQANYSGITKTLDEIKVDIKTILGLKR